MCPIVFCLFFPLFFVTFYEDDDDEVALSFSKACAPLWLDHLPTTALAQASSPNLNVNHFTTGAGIVLVQAKFLRKREFQ